MGESERARLEGIAAVVREWSWLIDAHLVNFFKDRLWESCDWLTCLALDPIPNLVRIPSGFVNPLWPPDLQAFLATLASLAYPRTPPLSDDSHSSLPPLVTQGMSPKKIHEVQHLSALIHSLTNHPNHDMMILDVGSGLGYLSQALCFHYNHPHLLSIDASPHHATVSHTRATRIHRSHRYATALLPTNVTCNVQSVHSLANLILSYSHSLSHSVLLVGLHACGDLSVTMLRTFLECPQVKALVSIGCCYNLLSEGRGFPLSRAAKSDAAALTLGKNLRDLASQSAERWKCMQTSSDEINNFELHAFRAAFQLVLDKFYPQVMDTSPSIGRQGKALRRRHLHNKSGLESNDNRCFLFTEYCHAGLACLGLKVVPDGELHKIWEQVQPYMPFIAPYCSLRAALGPLIETYILLDRLLFLEEQQGDSIQATMVPIFDPQVSPRNIAIMAIKKQPTS